MKTELHQETPVMKALERYILSGKTAEKFFHDLWENLQIGFVISSPWHFVMGRAVALEDERQSWLVYVAVGPLGEIIRSIPFRMDWISFERNGDGSLRVYPFDRLVKLAMKLNP